MRLISRLSRLHFIQQVLFKYAIDELVLQLTGSRLFYLLCKLSPDRWRHGETRKLPRSIRLRRALEELGPVFVKFGQMLSTRRDLLADDIAAELALLQDRVPAFSGAEAIATVESSLGDSIDALFQSFDATPIAAASIAQVHAAKLFSGEDVVVKVLRPDIRETIARDLSLMYLLATLATWFWADGKRLRPREVVAEYEKTIYDELDMQREAANAAQLRKNVENSEDLYIPEVFWDYTRGQVLVLERIKGIPISDIETLRQHGVDLKKLAERGVDIFFTQVFRDNFFHADMHPGNIFVSYETPLDPHYIAVDFGIVGSLTDQDRHYLSQNFLAFFDRDYHRVARLHVDSGWVPADTRVEEFESSIRTVCEPIFEKPLEEISFGQVLLRLFQTARRFNMEVQPQLVLLQKTLLNIEGLGRQLYPQLDLWATARPILKHWMMQQSGPSALLREVQRNIPEWGRMLPQMPGLVYQFLQSTDQGVGDLQSLQSGFTPYQNRSDPKAGLHWVKAVIYAICGATLFVSGVLVGLLQRGEHLTVAGLSLWAILLFGGAVWCVARSLRLAGQ
ncbi:ubiquinone biosynthesis regulatory protein kinase UbiB [Chromatiales bacterium (ex Bugula neritina AB1)]|nr:ubiquinone biosynthesis regulatory protein kinase UbiB [Chromatiales bacterium (ex Bugula neritina AB1)]